MEHGTFQIAGPALPHDLRGRSPGHPIRPGTLAGWVMQPEDPKPPMWQDVQGGCVWRANDGTACASGASKAHANAAMNKASTDAVRLRDLMPCTIGLDFMVRLQCGKALEIRSGGLPTQAAMRCRDHLRLAQKICRVDSGDR